MSQINVIGTIFGTSGYDIHTRSLANALDKQTNVRLSVNLVPNWETLVSDRELMMLKRQPTEDEINLIIALPDQWKMHTKNGRNWGFVVWEGDKVPTSWIKEIISPDIEWVFVPSHHTKEAILKTTSNPNLLDNKIKVIPHGVNLDLFYPTKKPEKFTFLCNKGFRNLEDRGGIQYAIQAYLEEFTNEEVELLIKINPAYGIPNLEEMLKKLGAKEGSPKISIITESVDYNKMNKFYNKGHVFVSPTRAESFNIPCLEAMACGLPVITTNFGGQTDFCNETTGWIVGGELKEVEFDVQYEGIKWLTPNISELRPKMREAYENRDSQGKIDRAIKVSQLFTWDSSAKKVADLI